MNFTDVQWSSYERQHVRNSGWQTQPDEAAETTPHSVGNHRSIRVRIKAEEYRMFIVFHNPKISEAFYPSAAYQICILYLSLKEKPVNIQEYFLFKTRILEFCHIGCFVFQCSKTFFFQIWDHNACFEKEKILPIVFITCISLPITWHFPWCSLVCRHEDGKGHKRSTTQVYRSSGTKSAHSSAAPMSPLKASKVSTVINNHTSSVKRSTRHGTGSSSAKR